MAFTESPKALQHEQKIELAQNRHSSGSTHSASSLSSPASCTRPAFLPPRTARRKRSICASTSAWLRSERRWKRPLLPRRRSDRASEPPDSAKTRSSGRRKSSPTSTLPSKTQPPASCGGPACPRPREALCGPSELATRWSCLNRSLTSSAKIGHQVRRVCRRGSRLGVPGAQDVRRRMSLP